MLPITLTIAGAAALINLWLSWRAGSVRIKHKIMVGDGGDPLMQARMRAHANFVEYAPFVLILMGLIELARGPHVSLWTAGIAFLLARIAHPFGMERPAPNPFRMAGILVTYLVLIGLAGWALAIPYLTPVATGGQVGPA